MLSEQDKYDAILEHVHNGLSKNKLSPAVKTFSSLMSTSSLSLSTAAPARQKLLQTNPQHSVTDLESVVGTQKGIAGVATTNIQDVCSESAKCWDLERLTDSRLLTATRAAAVSPCTEAAWPPRWQAPAAQATARSHTHTVHSRTSLQLGATMAVSGPSLPTPVQLHSLASNLSRLLHNCDVRGWTKICCAPLVGALQDQPPLLQLLQAAAHLCYESASCLSLVVSH